MVRIPKRVERRLSSGVGLFKKVLQDAKHRDVNESDTVTIVADMLGEVFGFDKYLEVTSEQSIRGTYCDLAVKIDGSIKYLIEVKAIGRNLKENHLRQATNYGANQGIPWVVLTNGIVWDIYKIKFECPVDCDHVCTINMLDINPRKDDDLDRLYILCREGSSKAKAAIEEYHQYTQVVNRFTVAELIGSDAILKAIRREIRRVPGASSVSVEDLRALLPEVLKRDATEGTEAQSARKIIKKAARRIPRKQSVAKEQEQMPPIAEGPPGS